VKVFEAPASYYFVPHRSRYSAQHPVLKHPQSYVLSSMPETKFHIRSKLQAIYFILYVSRQQTRKQKALHWMVPAFSLLLSSPDIWNLLQFEVSVGVSLYYAIALHSGDEISKYTYVKLCLLWYNAMYFRRNMCRLHLQVQSISQAWSTKQTENSTTYA
jgi:hypothetical protein